MNFSSLLWGIPFIGIICSMSLIPLIAARFWNKNSGYVTLFWTLIYVLCLGCNFGVVPSMLSVADSVFSDYISFIIQISALYIISGGIFVNLARKSTPFFNSMFLFVCSLLAGWIGTTGAATLMIRPMLRANSHREYRIHMVVFFIFLVGNIGGAFTPLGDPPLFVGFTNGIDFFWFIRHLYPYIFSTLLFLCLLFFIIDLFLMKQEERSTQGTFEMSDDAPKKFILKGKLNILLLLIVLLTVMLCNFPESFTVLQHKFRWSSVVRNIILCTVSLISLKYTSKYVRERNSFSLAPIKEVAELFAGIFITATPLISMLHQGNQGSLKWLFDQLTVNGNIVQKYFWISGLLSSILDNTPTFLIFFHLTSGDAQELMTTHSHLLTSFSIATVFMGALTYIGNAPNLMVKSIAQNYGVKMPSFLGYILWSVLILVPVFIVISYFL